MEQIDTLKGPPRHSVCQTYSLALKRSLTSHISYPGTTPPGFTQTVAVLLWAQPSAPALSLCLPGFPNPDPQIQLQISVSGVSPHVRTHFFHLPTCHPTCSTLQSAALCIVRHSLGQSQIPEDLWPQLPAHRTQDTVTTTV